MAIYSNARSARIKSMVYRRKTHLTIRRRKEVAPARGACGYETACFSLAWSAPERNCAAHVAVSLRTCFRHLFQAPVEDIYGACFGCSFGQFRSCSNFSLAEVLVAAIPQACGCGFSRHRPFISTNHCLISRALRSAGGTRGKLFGAAPDFSLSKCDSWRTLHTISLIVVAQQNMFA